MTACPAFPIVRKFALHIEETCHQSLRSMSVATVPFLEALLGPVRHRLPYVWQYPNCTVCNIAKTVASLLVASRAVPFQFYSMDD
jgi:hypothetical protein